VTPVFTAGFGRGRRACIALLAATLTACASAPPPPPPPRPISAIVTISAASDLNPNRDGRASPVFLRIYQLKDDAKFLNGTFDDVTARSDAVLAASVVAREERMVEPGATTDVTLEVPAETRLLGVVAEYSDLAASQWRAASPAPQGGLLTLFESHSLLITVGRQAVTVTLAPPKGPSPPKQAQQHKFSLPKLSMPKLSLPASAPAAPAAPVAPAAPAIAAPAAPAVAAPAVAVPAAPAVAVPAAPAVAVPSAPAAAVPSAPAAAIATPATPVPTAHKATPPTTPPTSGSSATPSPASQSLTDK
jgi:type VI secretion system protein VasD